MKSSQRFKDKLAAAWKATNSLVCVGLDPEPKKFPDRFRDAPGGIFEFNKAIVDATADLVCAYKPQFAHYAANAAENQLEHTIDYIKTRCPDAIVILDSKRGDIGSTAEQYAHEAFERYGADAVTVNPYLGRDSVEPFLKHGQGRDHPVPHFECRCARFPGPGCRRQEAVPARGGERREGMEFGGQLHAGGWRDLPRGTRRHPLTRWRSAVSGAGCRRAGRRRRQGDGGGQDAAGTGLVISSSRAILYASSGDDFAAAARKAAQEMRDSINAHR